MGDRFLDFSNSESKSEARNISMPEPPEDEILVKISTVSLSFRDVEGEDWRVAYLPFLRCCF